MWWQERKSADTLIRTPPLRPFFLTTTTKPPTLPCLRVPSRIQRNLAALQVLIFSLRSLSRRLARNARVCARKSCHIRTSPSEFDGTRHTEDHRELASEVFGCERYVLLWPSNLAVNDSVTRNVFSLPGRTVKDTSVPFSS
jgi:hypothetical protein